MEDIKAVGAFREYLREWCEILEQVCEPAVLLDSQFSLVHMNDEFLKISGHEREEVINRNFADVFIPEERRVKVKNTQLLIQSGIVEMQRYEESEFRTKDGNTLIMGWNNSTIQDKDGKFLGVSCIGENISHKVLRVPDGNSKSTTECILLPQRLPMCESATDYEVIRSIARDTGRVQLAVHRHTKEHVAIKLLKKELMTTEEQERARREIKIMKHLTSLNNPHIVKLIDGKESDTHFTIILEYLSGGELLSYVKQHGGLSEPEAQRLFNQLVVAIECCHSQNIIHRDIKLQNVLLSDSNDIKLIDFGLSNFMDKGVFRTTFCGTPLYAAPEILLGTRYQGPEVDVWSLGVVLYVMLTTEFPFKTIGDVLRGTLKDPPKVSSECVDLLRKVLVVEPSARATLSDILSHPWLSKNLNSPQAASPGQESSMKAPKRSQIDSDSSDGSESEQPVKKPKLTEEREST